MKTTNKEFTKSDRPESGFYNFLLQRIYSKVDGVDVSKIDRVIEVVTISQLKDLSVDIKKYNIKNTDGLAGRFENTRNYIFPVSAMEKILDAGDHAVFIANYNSAVKTLEKEIKQNSAVHKAVMDAIAPTVKTEEKQPDPVKSAIADVIPLNAKTEKTEKVQDPVKVETEKKAPAKTEVKKVLPLSEKIIVSGSPKVKKVVEKAINEHFGKEIVKADPVASVEKKEEKKQEKKEEKKQEKKEEKKQENKPVDPVVTKSVTVDSAYIDKLIAAAPVKKSKKKATVKKSDLEQIAALF